jgi:enoyl-[acyl-carrier protein] reductase I
MGWLGLEGRTVVVTGVANKKSVAWHVARGLEEEGARVVYVVRDLELRKALKRLLGEREVLLCDVERPDEIEALRDELAAQHPRLAGLVHSIAFADYEGGPKPFHETGKDEFLRAVDVSCYSLVALANALRELFEPPAAVVTISISDTRMAAENYGYMAPIKAALDSTVAFLAKSFSALGDVRFNAVKAGPLKTSASAGIPGYLASYLYAERATLRGRALETREVADAALYLLSPRSSGVNAQGLVIDAGMGVNYFDREIVARVADAEGPRGDGR